MIVSEHKTLSLHIQRGILSFTMVELLVVISIIMILISLLLPAFSKVKTSANSIICSSNLKSLGTAEMNYIGDSNEWFTPSYPGLDEDGSASYYWTNLLYPYLGGKGTSKEIFRANVNPDKSVYFCPAQTPHDTFDGRINDYPSYGLNVSLGGRGLVSYPQSVKLGAVKKQSAIVMFSDVQSAPEFPNRGYRVLTGGYFSPRHPKTANGKVNALWVDAHVSSLNVQWAKANANMILDYYNFIYNW